MLKYGSASCTLDLAANGKRSDFIDVAHSDDRLAYSSIRVPIAVIASGTGPTVILSAGNHGDEYEGQAIAHELFQQLSPDMIAGRLIFLPALNTPAVSARSRVSPLDQANMNRIFPGRPDAGPSFAIAGFVNEHLIPEADLIIDLHSGGTTANYLTCGFLCLGPDTALNTRNVELAEQFGAPYTATCLIDGTEGAFDSAAHVQGTMFLATELGGMGTLNLDATNTGRQGCLRLLRHIGVMPQEIFDDLGGTRLTGQRNMFFDYGAAGIDLYCRFSWSRQPARPARR